MCLDSLKWRLLKEAVGELMVKETKHRLKARLKGESLDKTLGMRRNPQTYFSISTVQKKEQEEEKAEGKGEEEEEEEKEEEKEGRFFSRRHCTPSEMLLPWKFFPTLLSDQAPNVFP